MEPPGSGPGSKPGPGPRPEPAPSSQSLKSDRSMTPPPNFKEDGPEDQSLYNMETQGSGPGSKPGTGPRSGPAPSSQSLKSDWSKQFPPNFREDGPEDQRDPDPEEPLDAIFRRLVEDVVTFVKEQLQKLHRLLTSNYPECSKREEKSSREVLNIALDFLKRMKQEQLVQRLQSRSPVGVCRDELKKHLQQRFSRVFEGVAKSGDSAPLTQIYTELYITEGGASEVNQEHESVSLDLLLVNLIRGSLLPSAHLWITTRPAAANQIPSECVSMVTEVRGFTNLQKEQYFRKRFRDERQATAIISHIKNVRSLHIMCHIPVFCWLLSTVLQKLLEQTEEPELPRTLTQMYTHFLVVQIKVQNIKYQQGTGEELHWTPQTREMVKALGKLAFEQLQRGNLIFYDCDLRECGLDAAAASVYSGVFTQVFREESGLYQDKVYCFIHLSVQEFLAAFHVHQTFYSSGKNLLKTPYYSVNLLKRPHSSNNLLKTPHSFESEETFYHCAVGQALQNPNGHLDLFLRFLLGLSLPTNQRLLSGLTQTGSGSGTNKEIAKYVKEKLNEKGLSAEKSMNLLHCLIELNDLSRVQLIQYYMGIGDLSSLASPADWSTVSFVLLSSDSGLPEFDLKKYRPSETALLGLLPVVRASTKVLLRECGLSPRSCGPLASVLSSSSLTHLDLSNNNLQDSGVELLCSGLKSASCGLHTLRLSGCLISERGGAALASALSPVFSHQSPAPSHLRELDLSYNHPGGSSQLLNALQEDPHCPLQELRLDPAGEHWMVPGLRKYSCEFSLEPNTGHRIHKLSEDKRTLTRGAEELQCPGHQDRLTDCCQFLSSTGLRGRCYWEVDWSKRLWSGQAIDIAVSHRGIRHRGTTEESPFGANDQSWSLRIYDGGYSLHHNDRQTGSSSFSSFSSSSSTSSGRVSVFLDSEAGFLSFYEVLSGGELSHLHTFTSSFSEPVFPGFGLRSEGCSVSVVDVSRAPPAEPK